MKPEQEPAKTEPVPAPIVPAAPAPAPAETAPKQEAQAGEPQQLAEPPKNIEFTEVSPEETSSVLATATAEHDAQTDKKPEPAKPAAKPPRSTSGSHPVFALSLAFIVFAALAVAAYYAYTKAK